MSKKKLFSEAKAEAKPEAEQEAETEIQQSGSVKATAYLEVLKYISSELDASTNPTLVPLRLHELRMKLQTFVADVEREIATDGTQPTEESEA